MIQDPILLDCFQFSQLDANTVSFYSYICTKVRICGNLFELLRLCIFNKSEIWFIILYIIHDQKASAKKANQVTTALQKQK